ncbi:MAG: hypothetical protein AB1650_07620 [Candidatus Omnitrophota bacterium]
MEMMDNQNKRKTNLHKGFLASSLQMEILSLQSLLTSVNEGEWSEDFYIRESLKMSMSNLKGLIKFLS